MPTGFDSNINNGSVAAGIHLFSGSIPVWYYRYSITVQGIVANVDLKLTQKSKLIAIVFCHGAMAWRAIVIFIKY